MGCQGWTVDRSGSGRGVEDGMGSDGVCNRLSCRYPACRRHVRSLCLRENLPRWSGGPVIWLGRSPGIAAGERVARATRAEPPAGGPPRDAPPLYSIDPPLKLPQIPM